MLTYAHAHATRRCSDLGFRGQLGREPLSGMAICDVRSIRPLHRRARFLCSASRLERVIETNRWNSLHLHV